MARYVEIKKIEATPTEYYYSVVSPVYAYLRTSSRKQLQSSSIIEALAKAAQDYAWLTQNYAGLAPDCPCLAVKVLTKILKNCNNIIVSVIILLSGDGVNHDEL